jgi:ribosomal protein S18 acetylase RimI-like enzyme
MTRIEPLTELDISSLRRVITGYVSAEKYEVGKTESDDYTSITLQLVRFNHPFVKQFDHLDEETYARYLQVLEHGFSYGAYDKNLLVGLALAEPHFWNRSLWVYEFHIAETHRRIGLGKQLMDCLVQKGKESGLRTIVCETQNTNVPAIKFYRKVGFMIDGVDLSYYTNDDWPDGEIAIFMKKPLIVGH